MRIVYLLLLPVLFALACGGPSPSARRAQRHLRAGQYDQAEWIADAELARSPKAPSMWRIKIQAAMGRRDAGSAVAHYERWKELRGGHDPASLWAMAMSTVWQALTLPSAPVQTHAVQTAERLELTELADPVSALMLDDDPRVVAAAAVAVLRYHPDAPMMAVRMLTSDDPRAREIAIEGIARKVGEHARHDLRPRLEDLAPGVRRAAIRALAAFDEQPEREAFAALARRDPDGTVRAAALHALARTGHPRATALARSALRDEYLGARLAAVELLARRGGDAARDDLIVLVAADDPFVALRAAVALTGDGDGDHGRAAAAAQRALAAKAWTARAAALNALGEVAPKQTAMSMIQRALANPSVHVRLAAARALARLGARDAAIAALAAALAASTGGESARLQAAADLAQLGDERGLLALAALASATDPQTRISAVNALGRADRPTDALVAALADESAEVRIHAADALLTMLADDD